MRSITTTVLALLLLLVAADPARPQTGQDLFQQALVKERAGGDLKGAIELYERIVRDFTTDRSLTASALIQLGQCYEKLGSTEAQRAYRRVVSEFGDQADFVAQARARLAALQAEAAPPANGPVARRVLSGEDMDQTSFWDMFPSPDGRRVAYVDVENYALWVRDLGSGQVRRIAPGLPSALCYSPRWSPDGKRIAVTLHDQEAPDARPGAPTVIKVFDVATGESFEVPGTRSADWKEPAAWTPDGRSLLVTTAPSYFVAVDDGRVTPLPGDVPGAWSLSPDGRFVAFMTGEDNQNLIFVQAVAGGPRHQITDKPGRVRTPIWLPDGSGVAYGADDGIWVMPLRNGDVAGPRRLALSTGRVVLRAFTDAGLFYRLEEDAEVTYAAYRVPMDPTSGRPTGAVESLPGGMPEGSTAFRWSPDMRRTAFFIRDPLSVAIRSEDLGAVTRFETPGPGGVIRNLWSTDGEEILIEFHQLKDEGGPDCAIQAFDVATGRMRPFLPAMHGSGGASFSADGQRMAYWNWESFGTGRRMGSISVATTGQSDGHIVATAHGGSDGPGFSGSIGGPKISPDGNRVLFARQAYGDPFPQDGAGVWVVGSDGTGARQIGTLTFVRGAVWDPTGRFVAYAGRADAGEGAPMVLRVVEVATGETHEVPLGDLASGDVSLEEWSADGRYLGLVATPQWEGYWATRARSEVWVVQGLEKGRQ